MLKTMASITECIAITGLLKNVFNNQNYHIINNTWGRTRNRILFNRNKCYPLFFSFDSTTRSNFESDINKRNFSLDNKLCNNNFFDINNCSNTKK